MRGDEQPSKPRPAVRKVADSVLKFIYKGRNVVHVWASKPKNKARIDARIAELRTAFEKENPELDQGSSKAKNTALNQKAAGWRSNIMTELYNQLTEEEQAIAQAEVEVGKGKLPENKEEL